MNSLNFKYRFKKWLLRGFIGFFLLIFIFLMVFIAINWNSDVSNSFDSKSNPYILSDQIYSFPLVVAHRGGGGIAPENTLLAFQKSHDLGVDILEMDVRLTKDDVLVVHHDRTIDRTSDGQGAVSNYLYPQLRQFNFGYHFHQKHGTKPLFITNELYDQMVEKYLFRKKGKEVIIPTLEEVLVQFPNRKLMIEIKDKGERGKLAARQLIDLLERYGLTKKVIIGSFHDEIINYVRKLNLDIVLGAGPIEGLKFTMSYLTGLPLFELDSDVLIFPMEIGPISLSMIDFLKIAHHRNLAVHYWTINEKAEMLKLVERRADGILTDYPDILMKLKNN